MTLSSVREALRFASQHWCWEAVQLGLSIVSCISYIIYTYTGE